MFKWPGFTLIHKRSTLYDIQFQTIKTGHTAHSGILQQKQFAVSTAIFGEVKRRNTWQTSFNCRKCINTSARILLVSEERGWRMTTMTDAMQILKTDVHMWFIHTVLLEPRKPHNKRFGLICELFFFFSFASSCLMPVWLNSWYVSERPSIRDNTTHTHRQITCPQKAAL